MMPLAQHSMSPRLPAWTGSPKGGQSPSLQKGTFVHPSHRIYRRAIKIYPNMEVYGATSPHNMSPNSDRLPPNQARASRRITSAFLFITYTYLQVLWVISLLHICPRTLWTVHWVGMAQLSYWKLLSLWNNFLIFYFVPYFITFAISYSLCVALNYDP